MATAKRQQEIAAQRVAHLPADEIKCRYCGETTAANSFKGYAHLYGPKRHIFIAAKPLTPESGTVAHLLATGRAFA